MFIEYVLLRWISIGYIPNRQVIMSYSVAVKRTIRERKNSKQNVQLHVYYWYVRILLKYLTPRTQFRFSKIYSLI